ncbi:class F sortase [Arthrobacter sp. TMN-50]
MNSEHTPSPHRQRTAAARGGIGYVLACVLLILSTACSSGISPQSETSAAPTPSALSRPAVEPAEPTSPVESAPVESAPPAEPTSPVESAPAIPGLTVSAAPTTNDGTEEPAALPPIRLTVPAADFDVQVLALTPTEGEVASQSIVPPFTLDAYWLTSYGSPGEGSTNTTYITGHSWEDRETPFNRLSTDVVVGDPLTLTTETGTLDYVVESVTTHDKDTLKTSDIWDIVPHRVVLISCYTDDLWGKNVIVTAVPAG